MSKYLDNTGVQYLWGKIKAAFVAKESGKGLSTNDYTTTDKNKVASALTAHQTIKQDGVTGATVNRFGTCSTAAGTAAKAVNITTGTFNLEAGARVSVKFSNANTANTPTLNVNSKGAKNIFHKGAQITSGGNKALLAGVVDFIYDGTQWHLIGNYVDTDTNTKVTSVGNHYTPTGTATLNSQSLEIDAPAYGVQFAEYVSLTTDAAGHVTAISQSRNTLQSKDAASGGTDISLVTTGEKATWNAKSNLALGTSSTTAAKGNHTHTLSLATDTGTNELTLAHGSKYKLTAGGDSFVFTMPASGNTDTKVTSAANHYAPSADSNSELTAAISGTAGSYALNTEYTLLTGVKAQRDAKGHVTGLTYTAQKVKDTNTTYGVATASANGLMAKADKSKLDSFGNAVIFQGTCDTAAATVAKVVTCADFTSADLVVGAKIYVTFTHTNSGARANLTMNVNGTGAKPLRELRNGAVSQIPGNGYIIANQTYVFTYDGTNWCTVMDYDSNSVDRLAMPHYIKAGSTGIFPYCLVALDKTGAWSAFTTSGGDGTNKTLNTTTDFLYPPEILVYEANNTAAANANVASSGASYASYPDVYLNYSCNCGTTGFDTNEPVYIQCNITSTGHWRFENITQTFVNGKYYIYLGKTRNEAGGYRIWLSDVHPVYYYDGTSLTEAESHRLGSCRIVVASKSGVSSLPTTISHSLVKSNMYVLQETLSNPHAQMGNWTVTTADGSVTISGNIHGSTDITLLLG